MPATKLPVPSAPAPAIVLCPGQFATPYGKTAHGLVRGSERFAVRAVVDAASAGRDAGEVLDGTPRGIPLVADVATALERLPDGAGWAVVGAATHGGTLSADLRAALLEAVRAGLSAVNGLHDALGDDAELVAAARASGAKLVDLRAIRPRCELHAWHGTVHRVRAARIAVLGTDCAVGKRTTTRWLVEALRGAGLSAEMIYTGQTGWLQGARHGFILDSTLNDYVSGELEHAVVTCAVDSAPDVMVIEGQSSLRNPSGPCGAELILSAGARAVVLQHSPARRNFEGFEDLDDQPGMRVPSLGEECALVRAYGARVLGVAVNGAGMTHAELADYCGAQRAALGVPVVAVLEDGPGALLPALRGYVDEQRSLAARSGRA